MGKNSESGPVHNYIVSYKYTCQDMLLNEEQKLNYLYYLLKDDALTSIQNEIEKKCSTLQDAITETENEFSPQTQQKQMYRELKSLDHEIFQKDYRSPSAAFSKPNSQILNNAHQNLKHHRNEATKTDFLRDAVLRCL